jgi:hypothetical protein
MNNSDDDTTCSVCGEDVGVVRPPYGKYTVIAIACTRKKCMDEIIEKNAWTPSGGIHYTSFYTTVFVPSECRGSAKSPN